MSSEEPEIPLPPYRDRIAILPGDPPIAYRPGVLLVDEDARQFVGDEGTPIFVARDAEGVVVDDAPPFGQWYQIEVDDSIGRVDELTRRGRNAQLDIVYFANNHDCCGCPPHPALAVTMAANPWSANPWSANPWSANPWSANPWSANPESLNLVATRKPPMSSVMPAPERALPKRPAIAGAERVVIGVLDSGLAGGRENTDQLRPELLGLDSAALHRIVGESDLPSRPTGKQPVDNYLDPVAGHGTFIAGIIEQLTPGCAIHVRRVFEPDGDVGVKTLALELWLLMRSTSATIVNLSFGGTGRDKMFEAVIDHYHDRGVVFVGAAGNEGSCREQFPAALPSVIGVAALGPTGPAAWSNYGPWVDACAPGTDIVSSFFARFDGATPPINGLDADDFTQWATWSGTSFAAPVVVAALAREMATTGATAVDAVQRIVHAPHLARLANMGTIVNY